MAPPVLFLFVSILVTAAATAAEAAAAADVSSHGIRCYSCTSYMNQCKEIVSRSPLHVHRKRCSGKCFIRQGEDGAIYRGCFDDFERVVYLKSNYLGCQNQTWNKRSLPWCFCNTELCNGVDMNTLKSAPHEQDRALEKHFVTTIPAVPNVDQKIFEYLGDEEGIGLERRERNSKGQNNLNRVIKNDKQALKELNNDVFKGFEIPAQSLREKIPPKTWIMGKYSEDTISTNRTLKADLKAAAKEETRPDTKQDTRQDTKQDTRQDIEAYDTDVADYPYNQDLRSISKMMQTMAKEGIPHDEPIHRKTLFGSRVNLISQQTAKERNNIIKAEPDHNRPQQKDTDHHISPHLASQMNCEESGYYEHPTDCTLYMACVFDPFTRSPIWHLMRCPGLLFWDNERKICVEFSINCRKSSTSDSENHI